MSLNGGLVKSAWFEKSRLDKLPKIEIDDLELDEKESKVDSDVLDEAIEIANALRSLEGKSPITTIRPTDEKEGQYVIENDSGTWSIRWGHAPSSTPVGEQSVEKKLDAMELVLANLYKEDVSQDERIKADIRFGSSEILREQSK